METPDDLAAPTTDRTEEEVVALGHELLGHDEVHEAIYRLVREAQETARCCGKCGAAIAATEPVWIGPFRNRGLVGWGTWNVPYCQKCAPRPGYRRVRYFATPSRCVTCGRHVYLRVTLGRVRDGFAPHAVACSEACRKALYRARYFRRKGSRERQCDVCGQVFTQTRSDAKTCSPACRQKAYRQRVTDTNSPPGRHS
jgi:hypothetical protein